MVLFELGMGKAAAAGLVKMAATSGTSGTAITILGPPPMGDATGLPTPLDAAIPAPPLYPDGSALDDPLLMSIFSAASSASSWFLPKMATFAGDMSDFGRELGTTAVSAGTPVVQAVVASAPVVQAGISGKACELMAASAAAYAVLAKMGYLDQEDDETDQDAVPTVKRYKDFTIIPMAISAFAISDILLATALVDSIGAPLAVPLRVFAIGGILLSFPLDWFVQWAKERVGLRKALCIELAAVAVAFFWLTWGTHLLSVSPIDAVNAPFLFWVCFAQCVLTWSGFSSIIVLTILSSAISACGQFRPK